MSNVQLAFLGPVQLRRADQLVELNTAKAQALLAYLTVTGAAHTREHLLNLLWAESHAEAARKNLRNHLWLIRQALGHDLLIGDGETIALAPTVWSDVQTFMALAAVPNEGEIEPTQGQTIIELWRGPLLEGIKLTEAPDFELWVTGERQRLGSLYLRALEQMISVRQRTNEWQEVLGLAQRGLSHEPTHEAFHQQVMVAHARLGGRSRALQHYDHLRRLLAAELNVEPLAATEALRRAIAQGEIAPLAEKSTPQSALPNLATTPATTVTQTPFIGRQHELAVLDNAWQQTTDGLMRIIMLNGELGIGKSHLWQYWSARLPSSQTILATRCLNTTQTLPYAPLARLLDRPICRQQFVRASSALLPIWRGELLRLAPALQPEAVKLVSTPLLTPGGEPGRLAEALLQFVRSFQANPLTLFIDDLHWADHATLDWLLYLSDRMAEEPLLLVGAYRPEDTGETLHRLLAQWQRAGQLTRLTLPHFTKEETTSLLKVIGGRLEMANHLHRQSSGNPYYLTQLSNMAADGIPADLTELVRVRLQQLPATAQLMVQAAAILEPHIAVDILAQTTQQSRAEVVDAVDCLLAATVLVEREGSYEFTHPLVASVVREGMSSVRRQLFHQRVAEELQTLYSHNLEVIAGQLAHHYAEAGLSKAAAGYFEMAGVQALHVAAVSEAAAFYRQAYQLDPTLDRQLGVGFALMYIPGALAEGRAVLQQVLIESEARQDQYGIVRAGLWLAHGYLAHDEGDQVL